MSTVEKKRKKKRRETRNGVLFIRNVPDELKNRFKAICARKGISMQDELITMLRKRVKDELDNREGSMLG